MTIPPLWPRRRAAHGRESGGAAPAAAPPHPDAPRPVPPPGAEPRGDPGRPAARGAPERPSLGPKARRRLRWGIAALAAAALLYLWLRPEPLPVEVAAITRGPLRVTVAEDGTTRVRERFIVSAPVAG